MACANEDHGIDLLTFGGCWYCGEKDEADRVTDLGTCTSCGAYGPAGKDHLSPRCAENGGSFQ